MTANKSPAARKGAKPPKLPAAKKDSDRNAVAEMKSEASQREPGKITAQQALENTRALLRAKRDKANRPPNYPIGEAVHPGAQGPHGLAAAQPEHAPTNRLVEAIHGHAYATERGDESKRDQS